MINLEILEKANSIEKHAIENKTTIKDQEEYFKKCCKVGICSICGSELSLNISNKSFFNREVFGKKEIFYSFIKVVCPNGHQIVNPKNGWDRAEISNSEWENCVNNTIALEHIKETNWDD